MIIRDRQMVGRMTERKITCNLANKSQPVLPYCKPYNKEALSRNGFSSYNHFLYFLQSKYRSKPHRLNYTRKRDLAKTHLSTGESWWDGNYPHQCSIPASFWPCLTKAVKCTASLWENENWFLLQSLIFLGALQLTAEAAWFPVQESQAAAYQNLSLPVYVVLQERKNETLK